MRRTTADQIPPKPATDPEDARSLRDYLESMALHAKRILGTHCQPSDDEALEALRAYLAPHYAPTYASRVDAASALEAIALLEQLSRVFESMQIGAPLPERGCADVPARLSAARQDKSFQAFMQSQCLGD